MKCLAVLLIAMVGLPSANACLGPETERANDKDATAKFVGTATGYQFEKTSGHALITFKVFRTLRGESREAWSLYFRSKSLPADLAEFQKRFGRVNEVGLRELTAPGEKADSKKKAFFIVDSACSANGEDWLLRKVSLVKRSKELK